MHRQVAAVGQNSGAAVFRFSLRANRSSTCRPSLTVENFLGSPKASQLDVGTPGENKNKVERFACWLFGIFPLRIDISPCFQRRKMNKKNNPLQKRP